MPDDSVSVDDIGGSVGDASVSSVLAEASIGSGDLLIDVRDEGDIHGTKSSFFPGLESVLHVREFGVDGDGDEFAADLPELVGLGIEGDDFGGADEGEVEGVEEEDHILSVVGLDVNVDKVISEPGDSLESRGGFSDE